MGQDFRYDLKQADVDEFLWRADDLLAMLAQTTRHRGTSRAWFASDIIDLRERLAEELRRIEAADPGDPLWMGLTVPGSRLSPPNCPP